MTARFNFDHRHQLTEAQAQVMELVAQGQANPDIATALHISVTAVQDRLRQIYLKLGVHSREDAIAQWQAR
jgi:DNA-binding NarL/FixJ family response regulator